ncbi:hypothetical protein LINPERHAP2_LOCUS25140 [Linum perenne]
MAKRSDFAQKLLDDLRLRKERMAVSNHHSSRGSKPVASDTYAYARQTNRGSRDMRTQQTQAGSRAASGHNRHRSSHKSFSMEDASKQLVPVRRGQQNHQQIGDLSMALTFAIENGAKLGRMDAPSSKSMLNFLQKISRRSGDWGNMQKPNTIDIHFSSSNHLPALSHQHIKEISKGAQRLNQILRACSNGLNIDTYSVDIGKELLKGATELEESLRMLVNLQESSDYKVTPQSKNRIKLLDDNNEEEEDDDDDKAVKGAVHMKQIGLPRFSFDKPSRNSSYTKDDARTDLKQRLLALPYPSELPENLSSVSSSSFVTHKRSSSHGSNMKNPAVSESRNQPSPSKPNPEKKRISNVVAKLMGLEEIPANEDVADVSTEKEASSRKKISGSVLSSLEKGNVNRRNTKDVENLVPPLGRKQKQVMQEKTYALDSGRNSTFQHDGRQIHKDVEGLNPMRGSNMANMKMDKQQSNNVLSQINRFRQDIKKKEWKQNTTEVKGAQNIDDFLEINPLRDQYQKVIISQPLKASEAATTWSAQTELRAEKRDTNRHTSSNQVKGPNKMSSQWKSPGSNGFQHQQLPTLAENFDTKDTKQQRNQIKRQELDHRSQAAPYGKIPIESGDARNTKRFGHSTSCEDIEQNKSRTNAIAHKQDSRSKNSDENSASRDLKPDDTLKKKKNIISPGPGKEVKPARPQTIEKAETTLIRAQKVATTRRIDELSEKRRGTSPNLSKLKQQASSTLSQKKQRGVDKRLSASKETHREKSGKFNQTKVPLVKSKKSTASIQQADIPEERETRAEEACKLHLQDHLSDDCESLQSPQVQASAENATMIKTDDQDDHQLNSGGNDDGHESRTIITDQIREDRTEIYNSHQQVEEKEQKVRQQKKLPEPLTEAENHLKKILVKNQRFVDTAEALFRLNIATDILNVSDSPDCNNEEENKLMIDCSFEVMKRKGKRQEILRRNHNPFTKLTVNCTERESLDGLIGKLYKDLEKLRMYGRKEKAESGIEEYLPKMLEIDVYGSEPDVNSMWEMGWEKVDTAFAQKDEVIKEVEKQVLNGLLDELTGDLLVVF